MPDNRVIGVVVISREGGTKVEYHHLTHGQHFGEENPVAVMSGALCPEEAGCWWCDELRNKIRSRRVF